MTTAATTAAMGAVTAATITAIAGATGEKVRRLEVSATVWVPWCAHWEPRSPSPGCADTCVYKLVRRRRQAVQNGRAHAWAGGASQYT